MHYGHRTLISAPPPPTTRKKRGATGDQNNLFKYPLRLKCEIRCDKNMWDGIYISKRSTNTFLLWILSSLFLHVFYNSCVFDYVLVWQHTRTWAKHHIYLHSPLVITYLVLHCKTLLSKYIYFCTIYKYVNYCYPAYLPNFMALHKIFIFLCLLPHIVLESKKIFFLL